MQQSQSVSVAMQVEQITRQLNSALLRKQEIEDNLAEVTKTITALRNVLAGLQLGMQLQKELEAKRKEEVPSE